MSNNYQINLSKLSKEDGGGFIGTVPELPGCVSDGETYEEALKNTKLAIDAWLSTCKIIGKKIPSPRLFKET